MINLITEMLMASLDAWLTTLLGYLSDSRINLLDTCVLNSGCYSCTSQDRGGAKVFWGLIPPQVAMLRRGSYIWDNIGYLQLHHLAHVRRNRKEGHGGLVVLISTFVGMLYGAIVGMRIR